MSWIEEPTQCTSKEMGSRLVSGILQTGDEQLWFDQTVVDKHSGDEVFGTDKSVIKEITPKIFRDEYLLKKENSRYSLMWPGVILFGGLPDTKKTTILNELLKRYVRKATIESNEMKSDSNDTQPLFDNEGMSVREVLAVGKKHQDLYWFELTSLNCYSYCMASALLNDAALSGQVIRLTLHPSLGLFRHNKILDHHFQNVYEELKKQSFLKPIDDPHGPHPSVQEKHCPIDVWKRYLPRGLVSMNFWDFGINKGIFHTASALSGYFSNSYTCLFLDLERDAENLFQPLSLESNRFDDHPDKFVAYKWRSRVQYLLRLALFAKSNPQLKPKNTVPEISTNKSCFIVAVYEGIEGSYDVKEKVKKLREILELIAEQMGLSKLLDFDILPFDLNKNDSYRALKQRLEDRITQESIDFPLSWLFIRSAYYQQPDVYVYKETYFSLAKSCKIDEDEFESFLATFTASGSLIYASTAGSLANYVILKPFQFFKKISKIFYPKVHTSETEFGIVSEAFATEMFNDDTPFYLTALTSLQLAIKLDTSKDIDLLSAGLDSNTPGPLYYLPALRCRAPVVGCELDSLHILLSIDIAPKCSQIAFIHSAFEVFRDSNMNIKLIPRSEVNVLQFEVSGIDIMPCRFEHVYQGDATEIRFHIGETTPPEVCQRMCDAVIITCHNTVAKHIQQYGPIKYGFAVMCTKDQKPSEPCNIKNVRHYLPELDEATCNTCQTKGNRSVLLNCWVKAVNKHMIDEDYRLYEGTLKIGEIIKIASHIASNCSDNDLKKFVAKLGLKQVFEVEKDRRFGIKKYIIGTIIEWEKKRNKQEPARMELGRILHDLNMPDFSTILRLS